jgi:translation initiation factor IF-3
MRAINKFLDEGDKVKVTIRFRGREFLHQELGLAVLNRVREEMDEKAKVEAFPKMEGRQMIMVIAPR